MGVGRMTVIGRCLFLLGCVAFRLQSTKQSFLGPQDLHSRGGTLGQGRQGTGLLNQPNDTKMGKGRCVREMK